MPPTRHSKKKWSYPNCFCILLVILLIGPIQAMSQKDSISPQKSRVSFESPIALAALNDTIDSTSTFFKKIFSVFKFRENKNKKEKERFDRFIDSLLKNSDLKIDSTTIVEMISDFEKNLDLDVTNGTKPFFGSCASSFISSSDLKIDSLIKNDTIYYFRRCLKPKIKILGTYDYHNKTVSEDYNFNYLSSINFCRYDLSPTGQSKTPVIINEFKTSSLLDNAKMNGCDIFLTVHNNQPEEISSFLHNLDAQKRFYDQLNKLSSRTDLKGINIDFEGILSGNKNLFFRFIETLNKQLEAREIPIYLVISIPALKDNDSKIKAEVYDFLKLNKHVYYYLVKTENMILHPKIESTSVVSTIEFYTGRKIPSEKLFIRVSWSDYSDVNSLTEKYNWVFNNKLGGISIIDIGCATDNSGLWENLRTELIQVDSILVDTNPVDKGTYNLKKGAGKDWTNEILIAVVVLILGSLFFYRKSLTNK